MADTREMFSLPAGVHYLNHAYMSPLSKKVVAAGRAAMDRLTRPWEIGAADFFRDGNLIRERFSRLVNAPQPDRVALIPASSYGLAQVARNTELHSGQNVVMVTEEFPSNRYVWRRRCETAAAELRETGRGSGRDATWTTGVLEAIDADTAVVTLSSVHWCDGSSLDLEAIGARAREVGAAFVVDGTQSVGAIPFDLQVIRPDALVCASYKWLTGPYSIGVVWLGERYSDGIPIEETWTTREHSDDFAGLVKNVDRYRPGAVRYDVGETANFVLVPMLVAALDQVLEWGPERIQEHSRTLTGPLLQELAERGFQVGPGIGGHLFGLRLPEGTRLEAVRARLESRNVHVSVRGDAIRVSCHLYNTVDDVQALRDALLD